MKFVLTLLCFQFFGVWAHSNNLPQRAVKKNSIEKRGIAVSDNLMCGKVGKDAAMDSIEKCRADRAITSYEYNSTTIVLCCVDK